jgi:hypothetical protein
MGLKLVIERECSRDHPDDPEYHLLSLEFTPQERGNYFGSTLAFF